MFLQKHINVLISGNALVDIECVQMLGKAQVYSENGNVYDAMLNQVFSKKYTLYIQNNNILDKHTKQ